METADSCSMVLPNSDPTQSSAREGLSKVTITPVHDQETPETLPNRKENSKLKQGRLLFPIQTTPTGSTSRETPGIITLDQDSGLNMSSISSSDAESTKSEENMETTCPVVDKQGLNNNTQMSTGEKAQKTTITVSATKTVKPKLTKAEREALKLQREKERAEVRAKREAERQRREKEKQQRELERKEKQHKKELELKERQEKREREEQEKRERREKKEAEKRKREEERKKSEQEKEQAKEEKLRKEQQQKQHFLKYFTKLPPKETTHKKDHKASDYSIITPFSVKTDMSLATLPRQSLTDTTKFDSIFKSQDTDIFTHSFMQNCKSKPRKCSQQPEAQKPEKPTSTSSNDDVIVVSTSLPRQQQSQIKRKFKLLQFHQNYRPAYFGTWSKTSRIVTSRNPLRKDTGLLDYEVDSDDEWEEEEPGESLSDSEGEEADSDEDSGDDDGFFVPHGYLSDGEGDQSDCEGGIGLMDIDDEHKKQKQLAKAKAWEAEFARKCQQLKPIKIGCVWGSRVKGEVQAKEEEFLQKFAAVSLVELPISIETKGETTVEKGCASGTSADSTKRPVPDEAMPDLIRLVHSTSMGLHRLVDTFRAHWGAKKYQEPVPPSSASSNTLNQSSPPTPVSQLTTTTPKTPNNNVYAQASGISKRQLEKKIQAIATKDSRPPTHKYLWYVHDDVFKQYNLDPNTLVPLLPLISPSPRSAKSATKASSPETPNSIGGGGINPAKKGLKRKLDGMKSLFKCFGQSNSKLENLEPPPNTKRLKLDTTSEESVTNNESTLKAAVTEQVVGVLQIKPTITTTNDCPNEDNISAPKKCRLDDNKVATDTVAMETLPVDVCKENTPLVADITALMPPPVLPHVTLM